MTVSKAAKKRIETIKAMSDPEEWRCGEDFAEEVMSQIETTCEMTDGEYTDLADSLVDWWEGDR